MSQTNSGPGIFVSPFTAPSAIINPVTGLSLVWDGVNKAWAYWNGTIWVYVSPFSAHHATDQVFSSGGATDSVLTFPVLANAVYRAVYYLYVVSTPVGLVVTPSPPSGSTFIIGSSNLGTVSSSNLTLSSNSFYDIVVTVSVGSTAGNVNIGYGGNGGATIKALSSMIAWQLN